MFRRRPKQQKEQAGLYGGPPPANVSYIMPDEESPHEATWLQWPHNYGWDADHIERLEPIWIEMTAALSQSERVYVIVYDAVEKERVQAVLANSANEKELDLSQVEYFIIPTDDVFCRDNGPIFVNDLEGQMFVQNWRFNGWGGKADFWWSSSVPGHVGRSLNLPVAYVPMVLEGGSFEVDGRGTLMAKRSSIINSNRNPGWTQAQVEEYMEVYLGVRNFIWLPGVKNQDITDDHIDATARFAQHGRTIVTTSRSDFLNRTEYDILENAQDVNGNHYDLVHLPLTARRVPGTGDYGIYTNYYAGNSVVLIPAYNDPNDRKAATILQSIYPEKKVVSILASELLKDGGVIHCVTQQQPLPLE